MGSQKCIVSEEEQRSAECCCFYADLLGEDSDHGEVWSGRHVSITCCSAEFQREGLTKGYLQSKFNMGALST